MSSSFFSEFLDRVRASDRILLFAHVRPDGDAVGSTRGLQKILRLTYPEKDIRVCMGGQVCEQMRFLDGTPDPAPTEEEYRDALGIVIDTATRDRIADQRYALCRELIKIDHHIPVDDYGDLSWIEEHFSSASEMIAQLRHELRDTLTIDREAASFIYTGMVTDSGRFRFRSVSGDTMRRAGRMLDQGIDTEWLYAHLYMRSAESLPFLGYAYSHIRFTENGAAYLLVSRAVQKKFALSFEEACASVSLLDSIRDSLIWLCFIECEDGSIRVRLRSRFVTVSALASCYGGGGHATASGATVQNRAEMRRLLSDADALLARYKAENTGWL
ncbi:MAG: bifunctional oligoribonuclease/PAP phosphatase NrnA [Clostridia bacterium]|nr:bifunctional oligoribonuclease/PAP phosphatase NrnA [Clostridia bacterium]